MAPPLPPPGQLIVENLILLSGSSAAFYNRYGHHISPTTFSKPGNSAPSYAVLHFLICVIDGDIAHTQFKPCFPILDREQERDFRKVVDTRLAILERNKLLPQGSARKSVIAAAGGDRFVDLLWSLSALAVQQACVRHPPYASASRLRLESPIPPPPPSVQSCGRADSTLSHQSSARSSRSLMSVNFRGSGGASHASHDHRGRDTSKQRRFLGAGMVNAAQQRAKDADSVRSRIHAERTTLARTAELGKVGEKTWSSEAESLRERIGEFEAKVRRLKGQLADMGFDEMGNDIRGKESEGLRKSCSREEFSDELKTSPIESMESGSSVDELLEPGDGCEDIAQDLSRILAFAAETKEARQEVERVFPGNRPVIVMDNDQSDGMQAKEAGAPGGKPKDMVQLVRAAADELEQATRRMDEIQEARKRAEETEAVLNTGGDGTEGGEKSMGAFDPSIGKAMLESAFLEHKDLVNSSQNLARVASELTELARGDVKRLPLSESDDSLQTIDPVATIPKPTWLNEATADASESKLTYANQPVISDGSKCSSDEVDTSRDVHQMSKALSSSKCPRQTTHPSSSGNSRRVKTSPQKPPERHLSRHVRSNSASISPRSRLDSLHGTPSSYLSAKAARSVRFAALPPSYSANRTVGFPREEVHLRARRHSPDVFPRSNENTAVEEDERSDTEASEIVSARDDRSETGRKQSNPRRPERKDVYARKDLTPGRRVVDEKFENQPRVPRIPRTQTPRRVVRKKEAIQRSVLKASTATTTKPVQRQVPPDKNREQRQTVNVTVSRGNSEVLQADEAEVKEDYTTTSASHDSKGPFEAEQVLQDHRNPGSWCVDDDTSMQKSKQEEDLACMHSPSLCDETDVGILANDMSTSCSAEKPQQEVQDTSFTQAEAQAKDSKNESEDEGNFSFSCEEEKSDHDGSGNPTDIPDKPTDDSAVITSIVTAEDIAPARGQDVGFEELVDLCTESAEGENGKTGETVVHDITITSEDCEKEGESIGIMKASGTSRTENMPPSARNLVDDKDRAQTELVESTALKPDLEEGAVKEHGGDATTTEVLESKEKPSLPNDSNCEAEPADSGSGPARDNVQKKLFMTPQPTRGQGRDRPKSQNVSRRSLAWKAAGSLLGNKYPPRGNVSSSPRKESRQSGYLPALSSDSSIGGQMEHSELLYSPASKAEEMDVEGLAEVARGGKGDSFFAGQTAQWQHSVQSQRAAAGGPTPSSSRLPSNRGVPGSSKGHGREASTSSARRSRMKSLKARLAAALK